MARVGTGTGNISPISIPPFHGATARLLVYNLICYFVLAILQFVATPVWAFILQHFGFSPYHVLHGEIWQLATYSFFNIGFINMIFAMMSLWYAGDFLEAQFGARWVNGAYFVSVIGGSLIALPIAYTHVFRLNETEIGAGCWAGIFGLLVAIAYHFGEMEMNVLFVLRMKAKVMVALYILLFTAEVLATSARFIALLQLAGGLAGYLYCRFAPRRGFGFSLSERYFAMRNEFYRAKRRRAAKKFEVYMRGQNRDVHFDKDGKYVDQDDKDPQDKRWMN